MTHKDPMRSLVVGLLALLPLMASCRADEVFGPWRIDPAEYEIVFKPPAWIGAAAAAPDGTIFLALFDGTIWRGGPDREWAQVASPGTLGPLQLYAPSSTTLFAAGGPHIYRWDEGGVWREEDTPIAKDRVLCDVWTSEIIWGLGGTSASNVFAVGRNGLIAHFDGTAWTLEENPLRTAETTRCSEASEDDLHAVSALGDETWAALETILHRSPAGQWTIIPRPPGTGGGPWFFGIAALPSGIWFGGHDGRRITDSPFRSADLTRLWRLRDGDWQQSTAPLENYGALRGASASPIGAAVFWGFRGEIVVVGSSGRARSYWLPDFSTYATVISDGHVYLMGYFDDGLKAVVLRLKP